jgi:hypothetical protein
MTLPASGALALGDINVELGNSRTTQIGVGGAAGRGLAGVASGAIRLGADYYGKANFGTLAFGIVGGGSAIPSPSSYNTTEKYTYSSDTFAAGGNMSTYRDYGKGAGSDKVMVATYGYANAASSPVVYYTSTEKYTYATDSSATGTDIYTSSQWFGTSFSSQSVGYYALGTKYPTPTVVNYGTRKYTFATDATANGANFTYTRTGGMGGASNKTVAVIQSGTTPTAPSGNIEKYTFATDSVSTGTAIANSQGYWVGTGNTTVGYFVVGTGTPSFTGGAKYTYATDTTSTVNNILSSTTRTNSVTLASNTAGIVAGGEKTTGPTATYTTSEKITFATDSNSVGGNMASSRRRAHSAGCSPNALQ